MTPIAQALVARGPGRLILAALLFFSLALHSTPAHADAKQRVDVEAVQGVLAVRSLDGWLLTESKGRNPIAAELVAPSSPTKKQWFYFIPALGQPSLLVHKSEVTAFDEVPGTKIEYAGYRDLKAGLRTLLKGSTTIAMEYAPKSGIDSLTRVDGATADMVRKMGVEIQSSADLVQLTKSLWGPDGRLAHYVAAHHLAKLRIEALDFIAERIRGERPVTEHDVQVFLENGFRVRGLNGEATVSAGDNTSKPAYRPKATKSALIKRGDLVVIKLNAAVADADRPIYASLSWVAVVDETVPERFRRVFDVAVAARDAAIAFIKEGVEKRRLVKGFQADQKAREAVGKAGMAARFVHRTGHSLDTSFEGDGANLDDYETHDTRNLVVGSGFTVAPGIYIPGDFGVLVEVNVHLMPGALEITTPVQRDITPLLK